MAKIKVKNISEAQRLIEKRALKYVAHLLSIAKEEVDLNTPVDTGLLKSDTKVIEPKRIGNRITGYVRNMNNEYALYVEYGVKGRVYNYHKKKRVFYSGVGARMFTRAYERIKKSFKT